MFFKKSPLKIELSDLELIQRFKENGDNKYVGELFKRYTHLVFGVCLKYLQDKDDSKDAVMEIFEALITVLPRHEVHNFKSWLYTYSKNHCLMQLRKRPLMVKLQELENTDAELMENEGSLHLNNKEKELLKLENALEQLNEPQRNCVKLFYLQEMSYAEVATATGYELNEVKSHLQNAKRNLKNYLVSRNEEI